MISVERRINLSRMSSYEVSVLVSISNFENEALEIERLWNRQQNRVVFRLPKPMHNLPIAPSIDCRGEDDLLEEIGGDSSRA